ncbi:MULTISPECIES: NADP-dependent oxidoreductase [unclassified Nocardioides]|uniref:NADP-dependent oxidoreductase n=1 Tax=unclassified Nocardioides TaxID=2615069 RepID=UPI0002EF73B5|nr:MULTISPECIES: NADP-dependent oxidoreductase [unclassified Nocardioides]
MDLHWIATAPGELSLVEYDVPPPGPGEVTIQVRAAGVNPADHKHAGRAAEFPRPVGYEVAGVLTAIGPDTEIASGGGAVGDEVVAFRVSGGWATALTTNAADVFAKPASLDWAEAANLLLAGATAADLLQVVGVSAGETILVHGASGAVGVSVLQQAALLGARVVGTASPGSFDRVERYAGVPVAHGDGLEQRVRAAAPEGIAAALDCIGTDEAVDVSLALVGDRNRIATIAAPQRAQAEGIIAIGGAHPNSKAYRDQVRPHLLALAADGRLEVPVARTFPLADALEAVALLRGGHPGGKLALLP